MNFTRQQYNDLLRQYPKLKPTEVKAAFERVHKACDKLRSDMLDEAFVNQLITPVSCDVVHTPLKFTIPGQPVGSPRQTQRDKWMKRPCVVKYRDWCNKARSSVPKGAILGAYRQVTFIAYLAFPKTYSNPKRINALGSPHIFKPDIDNLAKSLLDALFKQDSVIWKLSGEKKWDDGKGARIEVELK